MILFINKIKRNIIKEKYANTIETMKARRNSIQQETYHLKGFGIEQGVGYMVNEIILQGIGGSSESW